MVLGNWNEPTTGNEPWTEVGWKAFKESELPFIIASGEVPDLLVIARNAAVGFFLFSSMYALRIATAFRFLGKKSH